MDTPLSEEQRSRLNEANNNLNQSIYNYLKELKKTPEYTNKSTQNFLKSRVQSSLNWATLNNDNATFLATELSEALTSCIDRVITGLDEVEIQAKIHAANQSCNTQSELRELGKSLKRWETVNQIAKQKYELSGGDEVEIYLAYRTNLTKRGVILPVTTSQMRFERCSNVTKQDIDNAESIINMISEEEYNNFVEQWKPWQKFQRKQAVSTYDSLQDYNGDQKFSKEPCILSAKEFTQLDQPTILDKHVYEYNELIKWWVETGTEPILRKNCELSDMKKLKKL